MTGSVDGLDIDSLERRILRVETWLILLSIAAIATEDFLLGPQISLGPLFLIPLSYSALTHRLRTTLSLFVLCLVLRQAFGPIQDSSDPWLFFFRDLVIASVFIVTVGYLGRLGRERSLFFALARRQRDDLARELRKAAAVQSRLLELAEIPDGTLDVAAETKQLKSVGGDYFDFIDLGDGATVLVIADVAGKGVQAALFMPAVRIALRSIVSRVQDPALIVRELNEVLFGTTEARNYATLFLARLERGASKLTCVNAGHLPGLLLDDDGNSRWLDEGGTPVGLVEGMVYESERVALSPKGLLVLYSDGVSEAENARGEEFGVERIETIVRAHRHESAKAIAAAIQSGLSQFLEEGEPRDDTTLIVVRRGGNGDADISAG